MIRFYSLFVVDNDLMASPFVGRFNVLHDITLHRGATETVNFLLQHPLTPDQYEKLNIIYDPYTLAVEDIQVKSFKYQILITVTLTPKEIGSIRVGFAFPQTEYIHQARMKNIRSPLTTVPFNTLKREHETVAVK
jgi:hypothetical protein